MNSNELKHYEVSLGWNGDVVKANLSFHQGGGTSDYLEAHTKKSYKSMSTRAQTN